MPLLIAVFFYTPSPLLVVIAIAAAPALIKAWHHDSEDPETTRCYDVPLEVRLQSGAMYLGLALYLAVMTHETHGMIRLG